MKIKCLIVNSLYPPYTYGGAEKSVSLLAESLASYGHDILVVTLHNDRSISEEIVNGIRVIRLPINNIYWPFSSMATVNKLYKLVWHLLDFWNIKTYFEVAKILKSYVPDVVHTNNIRGLSTSIWSAAFKLKIPVIHTLRDYSLICSRGSMYKNGSICKGQCLDCEALSCIKKHLSNRVRFVVSNSDRTYFIHRKFNYFKHARSKTIFNIMRKNSLKIKKNVTVLRFGYIGRIEEMKGVEILLSSTASIIEDNWQLFIAGSGDAGYIDRLKVRFADSRIKWLGYVNEEDFFQNIDVCIVPSLWEEPLPRAIIEALSYGKAVICSNIGGNKEIAKLGRTVYLYEPNSIDQLSKILNKFIANPNNWKFGGFRSIEDECKLSKSVVVEKYLDVYLRAIHTRRA